MALGLVDPGIDYWEAQTGSMDEAKLKMAQHNAMRNKSDGGLIGG